MGRNIPAKFLAFCKKFLRAIKPRFSFHYVAYTVLIIFVVFSVINLVKATTPNPGHPWSEIGDGVFAVTNNQTSARTYTFPDANATVLTTNALVTVAQGGTGAGTLSGVLIGNGTSPFSAVALTAGQSIRMNAGGTAYEGFTPGSGNGDVNWGGNTNTVKKVLGSIDAYDIGFITNNTEKFTILSGGNIGIGVTNPLSKLQINGGVGSITNGLSFGDGDSGLFEISDDRLGISLGGNWKWDIQSTLFGSATSGGGQLNSAAASATNPGVAFVDDGNTGIGKAGTDVLSLIAGGVNVLNANSSGYVGIGTTSPGQKLEVSGNALFNSSALNLYLRGNSVGDPAITFSRYPGADLSLGAKIQYVMRSANVQESGALAFWTNPNTAAGTDLTEKMRISGEGYVGIGTTLPTAVLHLKAGTATASTAPLKFTSGTNLTAPEAGAMEWDGTNLYITQTSGPTRKTLAYTTDISSTAWLLNGQALGAKKTLGSTDAYDVGFITNNSERMTILSGGNVGIGTTAPTYKLSILGTTGVLKATGTTTTAANPIAYINDNNAEFEIYGTSGAINVGPYSDIAMNFVGNAGTENHMSILASGNVGIGTTSPTAVLHLKAGTATAGTAPLKLTAGTNLTNAEAGAVEWDGTNLFITQTTGPTRKTLAYTTDIPATGANTALSNLANVVINTSLISDQDSTDNLGSSSIYWSNTYTDRLYLNSTAYFDGGTAGTAALTGALTSTSTINGLTLSSVDITAPSGFNITPTGDFGLTQNSAKVFVSKETGATDYTLFLETGNVGIGDSNPGSNLSVLDNAQIGFTSGTVAPGKGLIVGGNVGIGTTSPGQLLDIGVTGSSAGVIRLAGSNRDYVDITSTSNAGAWTLTLPGGGGTLGYQLTTSGTGVTSWAAAGSLRSLKDIVGEITPEEGLEKILGTPIYKFKYKQGMGTGDSDTVYVGVMADESAWAMHYGGTVVNPVNTLGYMVLGIKATNTKLDGLDLRIKNIETLLAMDQIKDKIAFSANFLALFNDAITKVENGVVSMKGLIVDTLKIGSREKRTGITLYDEITGDPYCISVSGGVSKTTPGECIIVTPSDAELAAAGGATSSDKTPPTITLNGQNSIDILLDSSYKELGATAADDFDGAVAVIMNGSVDTTVPGSYTISYLAYDTAGNPATLVTRTVNVVETLPPAPAPDAGAGTTTGTGTPTGVTTDTTTGGTTTETTPAPTAETTPVPDLTTENTPAPVPEPAPTPAPEVTPEPTPTP